MKIAIDRFEENYAVCELQNGTIIQLPRVLFPDASEGDIFDIIKNVEDIEKRKDKISALAKELMEN